MTIRPPLCGSLSSAVPTAASCLWTERHFWDRLMHLQRSLRRSPPGEMTFEYLYRTCISHLTIFFLPLLRACHHLTTGILSMGCCRNMWRPVLSWSALQSVRFTRYGVSTLRPSSRPSSRRVGILAIADVCRIGSRVEKSF